MKTKAKQKGKCVFCGKPTNYNKAGIGYICAKCLGEYESAKSSGWEEYWKTEHNSTFKPQITL